MPIAEVATAEVGFAELGTAELGCVRKIREGRAEVNTTARL